MPVITLTTDIGQNDYIVGAIKGQLVSANAACNIVDITHHLSPYNYQQTAYICRNAYKHYPPGSFHILLVNLFDSNPAHLLIAAYNNQYIICPDNGILTMITGNKPNTIAAVQLPITKGIDTLQFTRVMAQSIAQLSAGKALQILGEPITNIEEKYPLRATIGPDWMEGQIIFIDNFENVVVNITSEEFNEQRRGRNFSIVFVRNEVINHISDNYAAAAAGEKLAWFNSAGYLEIAINKGNMAGLFGLQGFSDNVQQNVAQHNKQFYQTVRIYFE